MHRYSLYYRSNATLEYQPSIAFSEMNAMYASIFEFFRRFKEILSQDHYQIRYEANKNNDYKVYAFNELGNYWYPITLPRKLSVFASAVHIPSQDAIYIGI